MDKLSIDKLLQKTHDDLVAFLNDHPDEKWNTGPQGKWTIGQHIVHLTQSINPLNKALLLPHFVLRYKFSKANRPSRSYDEVVANYISKLVIPDRAVSPYSQNMQPTPPESKAKIIAQYTVATQKLRRRLSRISENDLDISLLPHPLMGRMTLREIIMWTSYHTEHHERTLREKY